MSAICKGSWVLGSACGRCERCNDEQSRLARALGESWLSWLGAPRNGHPFLATGVHTQAAPAGASPEVKAGDRWWAIVQFDVWRKASHGGEQFVFCKDGAPLWGAPIGWMFLPDLPADILT